MKFGLVYFREKTVEHFGKKGLSWHGAMVFYKCPITQERKIFYYDHISTGDSKQDWMAVLSIVESIAMQLKRDMPHIQKVNIQSDNAKCYQNGSLIFAMFIVFRNHGLSLRSYVHTETQDGKSSIDAHFAVRMRHVLAYVDMGMNVKSLLELYKALTANGGGINTVPTLFELDRNSIETLVAKYKNAFDYFSCIKRSNEVVFSE